MATDGTTKGKHVDDLLKKSCLMYYHGKFRECLQTLRKIDFEVFDTKEWILENNVLLCENKISHSSNFDVVADKFEKLNEKVTGIPPHPQSLPQETSIGLNFSCILLSAHVTHKVVDASFIAGSVLTNCILRASQTLAVGYDEWFSPKVVSTQESFSSDTLKVTVNLTKQLLKSKMNTVFFVPLISTCFILAVLWISRHEVEAGLHLLTILGNSLSDVTSNSPSCHQETILIDTSFTKQVFPLCLLPLPNDLGVNAIKAAVTFLTSLCYNYYKHDSIKALWILDGTAGIECTNTAPFVNYLKGLIYFERDDKDNAFQYFHSSLTNASPMDASTKAADLSMLGCCLSIKGKHHTAIAKFKEALSYDFTHLDCLFYVAQEYQALGQHEPEIQCLKYLCEALALQHNQDTKSQSLLQGHFMPFVDKMNGRTVNLHNATYWLGKRCLQLERVVQGAGCIWSGGRLASPLNPSGFQEAADTLLKVLKEARLPCFPQAASPYVLPSLLFLYRDCVFALLKSEREKDCVTLCENALEEAQDGKYKIELWNGDGISSKKRIRTTKESTQAIELHACFLEIFLCKAAGLLRMNQSLPSLECLQRVFEVLETCIGSPEDDEHYGGKELKRRKLESGNFKGVPNTSTHITKCFDGKITGLEQKRLLQVKSQAHLIRALAMLQLLDQEKEGLEELHQSLLCDQDNIAALHKYCTLLFKLGSKKAAISDWMKFRGLESSSKKPNQDFKNRNHECPETLSFYNVPQKELTNMDDLALNYT